MSWLLAWNVKNFLKEEDPNKVLDVAAQDYGLHNIHCREASLVLYTICEEPQKYEIVLHRPFNETLTEAYSLCRCVNLETAELKFLLYKDKLPVIVTASKDLYNAAQIQKICDLLTEKPTWNLAHVIVRLGLDNLLSDERVAEYINTENIEDGMSPLQLAIQDQNFKMVQALLNKNASLDHFDNENNSVLHYAACTNRQIVNGICERSKNVLNSRNVFGRTPLHMACSADKRDCVHALLEAGADVNISVVERRTSLRIPSCVSSMQDLPKKLHGDDIKNGGTPLHWACSREVIEALVNKNCDINSLNFDQRTALHIMVLRNRLDCLVTLLSLKADCNIGDKDGNTPLHLAVQLENEACVKALIVFGADMSYLNNKNHLPRHGISCTSSVGSKIIYILHSVGAPRCAKFKESCNDGCRFDGNFYGTEPVLPIFPSSRIILDSILSSNIDESLERKKGRLLCLDGGGIRGLILIMILMELEKYLERPIYECFDWIAGTSTGGILALAVASKKPLFDCLCLYFKLKDTVFCGRRPYTSETFEKILKEVFGESTTMKDIKEPKVMITGTLTDRIPVDLHLFRNYPSPNEILEIPQVGNLPKLPDRNELSLWEIARATGAAPAYFRAFGKFLDGGLISNNPTLDALTEVVELNAAWTAAEREDEVMPVSMVLSIGTGVIPVNLLKAEVDVFRPSSFWDASKFVFGLSTMSRILIDQATQADGRVVDRARSWCSSLKIPYFRFSPEITMEVSMDEKSNEILTNMLWETKAYMYSKKSEIIAMVRYLKRLS